MKEQQAAKYSHSEIILIDMSNLFRKINKHFHIGDNKGGHALHY